MRVVQLARLSAMDQPLDAALERAQRAGRLDPSAAAWWLRESLYALVYIAWERIHLGRLAARDARPWSCAPGCPVPPGREAPGRAGPPPSGQDDEELAPDERAFRPSSCSTARDDVWTGEHVEGSNRVSSLDFSTSDWALERGLPVIDCVAWPNRPTSSIW